MLDEAINRPAWADGDAMGSGTSFDDLHRDSGGGRRIPKLRNYESLVKIGMVSRESAFSLQHVMLSRGSYCLPST